MRIFEPISYRNRLIMYNWQENTWPQFTYDLSSLQEYLYSFAQMQGRISGLVQGLPESIEETSILDIMVAEAVKTSAIEGEYLSREDVLSSIRNNLGLNRHPVRIKDKRASGVAQLMVAVRKDFAQALTEEMLFQWHHMLMQPFAHINAGQWRRGQEPMRIISGSIGKETVHFEAPPSDRVSSEMKQFINWYNETAPGNPNAQFHAPVRAAIAHLYFESIHPFEDGNGRMGRALSEKALSQGAGSPVLLSLSQAIEAKRSEYYQALKTAQRAHEITPWIQYFVRTILEAQELAIQQISFTISKVRFFDNYAERINLRQEKVLNRMFEAGPNGFEGGISAKKYMSIAKTSKATATRDLQSLHEMGALSIEGRGRATRYSLSLARSQV